MYTTSTRRDSLQKRGSWTTWQKAMPPKKEFSGLKGGFFNVPPPKAVKKNATPVVKKEDDIPFLKASKAPKKDPLVFEQVQSSMRNELSSKSKGTLFKIE